MRACLAIASLLLATSGCVTVESAYKSGGAPTASYDLQCPAEQLEMTVLNRNEGLGCAGSKIGVRGCGKQTTYVCNDSQLWIRETEVQPVAP